MKMLLRIKRLPRSPLLLPNERNAITKLNSQLGNGNMEICLRILHVLVELQINLDFLWTVTGTLLNSLNCFLDDNVISLMVTNSVKYAGQQKGEHSFEHTNENMKLFLAKQFFCSVNMLFYQGGACTGSIGQICWTQLLQKPCREKSVKTPCVGQARRWSNKDKKTISVPQSYLVSTYNKCMGGFDRLDQNIATYRFSIRTKKWWWPDFSFLVSASINNAWILYRQSPSNETHKLDLLEFSTEYCEHISSECIRTFTPPRAFFRNFPRMNTCRSIAEISVINSSI